MKITVFGVVTTCISEGVRSFGGINHLHLQGKRLSQARDQQKQVVREATAEVYLNVDLPYSPLV
jgi:hypothetical protein